MTLFHEFFEASAGRFASRVALRHKTRNFTYEELNERSRALAGAMAGLGIGRGDRVVTYLQNRPEVVECALACSRLGAIFVPANPLLKNRQLLHVLRDSGARMIISSAAANGRDAMRACPDLLVVECDSNGSPRPGARAYEDLLREAGSTRPSAVIDRDAAAILYTSGSTGKPKGVVVSHRNLVSGAHCVVSYLGNVAEDRLLAALPLSFDYGFSQVSTAFAVGACAVLSGYSTGAALVQEVCQQRITGLAGVPTMWSHLASNEWPDEAAQTLRYITNSGGAFSPAMQRRLQNRLPSTRIYCMYGLTEAFRSTYLHPDDLAAHPGSIGKAIPNQEIVVLRPDGTRCAPGEPGELVHRGSLVTLGYWNDTELTRRRFRPYQSLNSGLVDETVVWSGDLVMADEEGFLYFLGRNDQLLKTSGYRVSPTEIEEIALEMPAVLEAVVVGLPDDVLGHRLALALVLQKGARADLVETIRHQMRQQLPPYMVPASIHVVESIPRTPNGKQDRGALTVELQALAVAPPELAARSSK